MIVIVVFFPAKNHLFMGQALNLSTRQEIIRLRESGQSFATISSDLGLSYSGVRLIWQRYRDHGLSGLGNSYSNCGKSGPRFSPLIVRAACWLKRLNPACGAPLIHCRLTQRYPDQRIPSIRTMQVWFKEQKLQPRRRHSPPRDTPLGQIST